MSTGLQGGTFMEDYTYHFDNGNDLVLGSHSLEVCPTIATAENRSSTFSRWASAAKRINAPDLQYSNRPGDRRQPDRPEGDRFRLLVNTIETVPTPHDLRSYRWPQRPNGKRSRICVPRQASDRRRRTIPSSAMR
ncbi:hypothetical protein MJ561_05065 [Klebsiella pneumoniae]|nr:hypothetical protein MJ561_05065 [Klebsiella pneumoniae]